jgi:hypothetical protein
MQPTGKNWLRPQARNRNLVRTLRTLTFVTSSPVLTLFAPWLKKANLVEVVNTGHLTTSR